MTEYREDIRNEALRELYFKFSDKPRFRALIEALALGSQKIEDAAVDVIQTLTISSATGRQLELLGAIVNAPRLDLNDGQFRRMIRATISANRSNGRSADLIEVWSLATVVDLLNDEIAYIERYPAQFTLIVRTVRRPLGEERKRIARLMELAKAAGVGSRLIVGSDDSLRFQVRGSGIPTFDGPTFSSLI